MNFLSRRTPYLEHSIYARRRSDMVAEKKERNKKRQPVRQKSGKVAENFEQEVVGGSCECSFVNPVSLGFLSKLRLELESIFSL